MDIQIFFAQHSWWLLPFILFGLKLAIELLLFNVIDEDVAMALRRFGQELCFLSLSFYGLALMDPDSAISHNSPFTFFAFIILVTLYGVSVWIYKKFITKYINSRELRVRYLNLKQWSLLFASTVPGLLAIAMSTTLF